MRLLRLSERFQTRGDVESDAEWCKNNDIHDPNWAKSVTLRGIKKNPISEIVLIDFFGESLTGRAAEFFSEIAKKIQPSFRERDHYGSTTALHVAGEGLQYLGELLTYDRVKSIN